MPISIIFPINLSEHGIGPALVSNPRLGIQGRVVTSSTSFGARSYSDWDAADAIKQNLKMLLLTRKGEYVMDHNYGVGLPEYLFELHTNIDLSTLESKIFSQTAEYLPYMTISNLVVSTNPEQNILNIKIEFFYNGNEILEIFELEVI